MPTRTLNRNAEALRSNCRLTPPPPMITATRAVGGAMKRNPLLTWGCFYSQSRAMNSTS
jgi:O6-methylguanine-DNA--protein-cysteine methyltransferase